MQDKHNNAFFVLILLLYAFCFILRGFYNFSITLFAASYAFCHRSGVFAYNDKHA